MRSDFFLSYFTEMIISTEIGGGGDTESESKKINSLISSPGRSTGNKIVLRFGLLRKVTCHGVNKLGFKCNKWVEKGVKC